MRNKSVAVLIPCYNEELTIGQVIDDFRAALPHADIYVYDNNSTDDSAKIAADHAAFVVKSPIQGKGAVVQQMFSQIDADWYLMVDADNTYPAKFAQSMLDGAEERECDMVIGDRLSCNYYEDNKRQFHGFGNALVKVLVNLLYHGRAVDLRTGTVRYVTDIMTGYRVFSRKFVKEVKLTSTGFEIETEMTIRALQGKYRIGTMPVLYLDRPAGSCSKLSTFSDGRKVLHTIFSMWHQPHKMTA